MPSQLQLPEAPIDWRMNFQFPRSNSPRVPQAQASRPRSPASHGGTEAARGWPLGDSSSAGVAGWAAGRPLHGLWALRPLRHVVAHDAREQVPPPPTEAQQVTSIRKRGPREILTTVPVQRCVCVCAGGEHIILELINTAWLLKNTYCSNRITSQRDGSRACNHDASSSGFPLAPQMSPAQPQAAPPPSPSWLHWPVSGDRTPSSPCKSKAQSPGSSRSLHVTPGVKTLPPSSTRPGFPRELTMDKPLPPRWPRCSESHTLSPHRLLLCLA